MHQSDVLAYLEQHGALVKGHFQLSSGLHSPDYVQSSLVLGDPVAAETLGAALADRCRAAMGFARVDCVIGPALGGVVLAFVMARHLGARALFAERRQGIMALTRGLIVQPAEKVLVIEDVVITGSTVRELLDLVAERQGQVLGVGALLDRSGADLDLDVPFVSLARLDTEVYTPEQCPLCRQQLPLTRPKHGRI